MIDYNLSSDYHYYVYSFSHLKLLAKFLVCVVFWYDKEKAQHFFILFRIFSWTWPPIIGYHNLKRDASFLTGIWKFTYSHNMNI